MYIVKYVHTHYTAHKNPPPTVILNTADRSSAVSFSLQLPAFVLGQKARQLMTRGFALSFRRVYILWTNATECQRGKISEHAE